MIPKIPFIIYGADYNPEQWPETLWPEDMRLMRDCGVNLVHVGIFAWSKLNPKPGVYDFNWLDRILDLLAENGIYAGLATATASPPAWLARLHPDSLPVDAAGTRLSHGSRQHYTPNSNAYWTHASALVEQLAIRYAQHPALAEWHVNNEYGCHVQLSFGEEDALAWRQWLIERYSDLDTLNEAWGTSFWSQVYHQWEEIGTPCKMPYQPNPAMALDYKRFFSDAFRELFRREKAILRRLTPEVPVTTNFMGLFPTIDQFSWADDLDFAALDSYPDPKDATNPFGLPISHDLTRGIKQAPFVLMEQVTSQVNWRPTNHLKAPGQMRLWSLQSVARGGDGIMFFQWRKSRYGAEKYHGAMVPHTPPEQSREYEESRRLGHDLQRLAPVRGSQVQAETAILYDWSNRWLLEAESAPRRFDYEGIVGEFHTALLRGGITADISPAERDLSAYRLVIAPLAYIVSEKAADNLRRFVANGGTLIMSFFSGVVDDRGHIALGGYPGKLRDLFGLWVEEWEPLEEGNPVELSMGDAVTTGSIFSERIHLEGAEVVADYASGRFAGEPAICRNRHGKGEAFYISTLPASDFLAPWMASVATQSGVARPIGQPPAGLEVVERVKGSERFLFLLNHNPHPIECQAKEINGLDLLTGASVGPTATLAPYGAMVIQQ
jgi:beta-galactosidase